MLREIFNETKLECEFPTQEFMVIMSYLIETFFELF